MLELNEFFKQAYNEVHVDLKYAMHLYFQIKYQLW